MPGLSRARLDARSHSLCATFAVTLSLLVGIPLALPAAASEDDMTAAREYCIASGGRVQVRDAMWATNDDPAAWVDLGRSVQVCRFQADDEAQSRIYVDLLTLWSQKPSLAGAAYLARAPMDVDATRGDPATLYCALLGGTSQYGMGAAGGGWVALDDPFDVVVSMCLFADGSMIDEWGIAYHAGDAVRGADLELLMRSAAETYPPIYPPTGR